MEKIAVLLVDDNPTFLQLAASYLAKQEGIVVVGTIDKVQLRSSKPES